MPLEWIALRAPRASCLDAGGSVRRIAAKLALGSAAPDYQLLNRASAVRRDDGSTGRVHSCGEWRDAGVHARLGEALGELSPALRPGFEWYQCRGAFFHNDAHYDGRMFGIWYVVGPAVDVVFPRVSARLPITVGSIVIFDPFEVHGVLAPGRTAYAPDEYERTEPSVFVGFELDLTPDVAQAFGVEPDAGGGEIISSRTRICAASGAINGS